MRWISAVQDAAAQLRGTQRAIDQVRFSGARIANARDLNEGHAKAIRKTQCDMQGRFLFPELPGGKWIIVTRVTFDGPGWNDDSTLVTEIETKQGEIAKAILSNPNRI